MSVNELAQYMVASDTARLGILRRAKHPQVPPIIRYRDIRAPICRYLADGNRRLVPLLSAEETLRERAADVNEGPLRRDDAEKSIEVLHAVQGMANELTQYDFHLAPHDQEKLMLSGVEISVRVDLVVHGTARGGANQIGGAVLRMTQDDAETENARASRREMGLYVATLVWRHVQEDIVSNRTPAQRICMSIDIQHGEVFLAPSAVTRRMNDLQSACTMIAAIWPTL